MSFVGARREGGSSLGESGGVRVKVELLTVEVSRARE
jgi:hypothetical protein